MNEGKLKFGDECEVAKAIRDAIGVGDFDEVKVLLPQFERDDGKKITYFPKDAAAIDALKEAPPEILREIGFQVWDTFDGMREEEEELRKSFAAKHKKFIREGEMTKAEGTLWLFPGEWHDHIPEGYVIIDVFGRESEFVRRAGDVETRYGALAYGIAGPLHEEKAK